MPVTSDTTPVPTDDKARAAKPEAKSETMRVVVAPSRTVTDGSGKVHHPGAELDLPLADANLAVENGFATKPGATTEQRPLPGERDDTTRRV